MNLELFDYIITYVCISLACAYLLFAWFHTTLPIHTTHLIKIAGFQKNNICWSIFDPNIMLRKDWEIWYTSFNKKWILLQTLLSCPICLSLHICFWLSALTYILLPVSYKILIIYPLSTPYLALFLYKKLVKLFKV